MVEQIESAIDYSLWIKLREIENTIKEYKKLKEKLIEKKIISEVEIK